MAGDQDDALGAMVCVSIGLSGHRHTALSPLDLAYGARLDFADRCSGA